MRSEAVMEKNIPLEIERKYLIQLPDLKKMSRMDAFKSSDIIQTYLVSKNGETRRVRMRETNGVKVYTKTEKFRISDITHIENESELTENEYKEALKERDTSLNDVIKSRKCFDYEGHTLEIDIYPFWDNVAIMEVELEREDEEILFPDFIRIIREVTHEKAFKNRKIAERIPDLNL